MEAEVYHKMASFEDRHWWFVGRRKICDRLLAKLSLPADARIMEAGCGTGGNLKMLSRYGDVVGMELDETAITFATARNVGHVTYGCLPGNIPLDKRSFDLIVLFDVLEHIEEDKVTLEALREYLKPSGRLLITVPAYHYLWSRHDEIHHHKRRYDKRKLFSIVSTAGYNVEYISYYNIFLLPLMAFVRLLQRLTGISLSNELEMPSTIVNKILGNIFASERFIIGRLSLPFGGSIILTANKAYKN